MKGSQRKKPRPFVAATKPLDTPNLKKKAHRGGKSDNGNDERQACAGSTKTAVETAGAGSVFETNLYSRTNGLALANINKPTEQTERFLEGTLDMQQPSTAAAAPSAMQQSTPLRKHPASSASTEVLRTNGAAPAPAGRTAPSLVQKLKEFPVTLSKGTGSHGWSHGLDIEANRKIKAGEMVLREQPHCFTIDVMHNRGHCAACLRAFKSTKVVCPGCNLVHYCSKACLSKDHGLHHVSGECAWCAARDSATNAASSRDHALVRLALRVLQVQGAMDGLDRKLLGRVPRYGQWFGSVASRLKPEALQAMQPVLDIWRSRLSALRKRAELATVACPAINPEHLQAAVYQVAVGATSVLDLGGNQLCWALHPLAPFLRHSCRPNVQLVFDGAVLEVRALREVAAGEQLSAALVELYSPTSQRRNVLLQRFGYSCTCARCKVPKAEGWEAQLSAWRKLPSAQQREALVGKWLQRLNLARQLLVLAKSGKEQYLAQVQATAEQVQQQCSQLLGPSHFLMFQVQLLQLELAEAQKEWQAVVGLGPWLLQHLELSHPPNHPLVGWISRKVAMALHWLSENKDAGTLLRAADYADEAHSVLSISCGTGHLATREVRILAEVLRRKAAALQA